MKLIKELLTEDQQRIIDGDKNLIGNISKTLNEAVSMLNMLNRDFTKLGIHSADIDPYMTYIIEDFANLEDTDSMNLNLALLYERLQEFEEENK